MSTEKTTLLRLAEQTEQVNKTLATFEETVKALPTLFRGLEDLNIEPKFVVDSSWMLIQFNGDGAKLADVWGLLRRHGYNTSMRPEKNATAFYSFWERDGFAKLFMYFTSTVCQLVQVGTETVEKPIYEVRCGEIPELETESV